MWRKCSNLRDIDFKTQMLTLKKTIYMYITLKGLMEFKLETLPFKTYDTIPNIYIL
jgi:hypothetical protein